MSAAPTSRSDVQHHRNAGWPTGRESQGHGVLVVVGDGESPLQGEGGQVGRPLKGEGSEMDNYLTRVDAAQLESCLRSKDSRAVRRGAVGKVPQANSLAVYSTASPVRRGAVGEGPMTAKSCR